MKVLGVIDIRGLKAVHARGGVREQYQPVRDGSPGGLARWYVEECGVDALYVADLDAIAGRSMQKAAIREVVAAGIDVWVDAGVAAADAASDVRDLGAAQVIVGLETLPSLPALSAIVGRIGRDAVVFGLDLHGGRPMGPRDAPAGDAESLMPKIVAEGVGAVLLLDLARVGTGHGIDHGLVSRVKRAHPDVLVVAGGGIGGPADLAPLQSAGCDAVLIASALLDGRITHADLAHARSRR